MVSIPFFETNMCKFAIEMEMNFSITMGKNMPFLSEYFLIIFFIFLMAKDYLESAQEYIQ